MKKTELLRKLNEYCRIGDAWLDSIPGEIRDGYFDNTYVTSLHNINELLIKQVYGDQSEYVFDILYSTTNTIGIDDKIYDVEQFIEWSKTNLGWE